MVGGGWRLPGGWRREADGDWFVGIGMGVGVKVVVVRGVEEGSQEMVRVKCSWRDGIDEGLGR